MTWAIQKNSWLSRPKARRQKMLREKQTKDLIAPTLQRNAMSKHNIQEMRRTTRQRAKAKAKRTFCILLHPLKRMLPRWLWYIDVYRWKAKIHLDPPTSACPVATEPDLLDPRNLHETCEYQLSTQRWFPCQDPSAKSAAKKKAKAGLSPFASGCQRP